MNHAKQALFSGVLDSDTGPAIVNRAYVSRGDGWLVSPTRRPGPATVVWFARQRGRLSGVVVSSTSTYHVVLLLLARVFRIQGFYLAHGVAKTEMRINGRRSLRHAWVEALTVLFATEVLAVSPVLATQMKVSFPHAGGKVSVLTNGGDTDHVARRALEPRPPRHVRIMTVGTRPIKNLDVLLTVLASGGIEDVELLVVGALEGFPTPQGSRVRIVVHERLTHDEVLAWMDSSDIYVQLSHVEPFGLAVCEAAASGCSLLLSSSVGARHVLTGLGESNVLTFPITSHELADKLGALVDAVRAGTRTRHECARTWATAARELRSKVDPSW